MCCKVVSCWFDTAEMVGIGACCQGRDGSSMVMCIAVLLNCAAGRTEDAAVRSPSAAEFDGNLRSVCC